ncbi:MAG: DUF6543 domain-containing protein [Pseudomonas sp.]|uniref:dermonecrotic toxin domain-containing protein n=1 Tax=Pseudomonas sp. TaxID=306 RepID=UPI003C715629
MPLTVPEPGPHDSLIKHAIPWLLEASPPRAQALGDASLTIAPWFSEGSLDDQRALKHANGLAWAAQNKVDKHLQDVQDLHGFARPLLRKALMLRHGVEVDVDQAQLFLVTQAGSLISGSTSRTVSLLDAALHNFAADERFTDASCYISKPDASGHFEVVALARHMSIDAFIALCRELDLGAKYQRHLQRHLLPPTLQAPVIASQQATLHAAAQMALLKQDITHAQVQLLARVLKGERGVMRFYNLQVMDTLLTGILLIAADLDSAREAVPLLAYIPHDPAAPLKQYASTLALMEDLNKRLQEADYAQFFSRFVDQQQRGHFFSAVQKRPVQLRFAAVRIDGDLWPSLYRQALNKIFNDARQLAVSTADCDSRARWAWWDNFSKLLENVFNAALLVITPFVPFLGELMLAYTAYQLLDEVVEGVVDLAEGQKLEAAEHLVGVVTSAVQLATFGAAGKIVQRLSSPFVNQLRPVQVNGKTRLWNPDLQPYARERSPTSAADALGLHSHQGDTLLPLDGTHYAVTYDPASGEHRVLHPRRADAYQPLLRHNGQGAWTHEAEDPRAWDGAHLLRRLGPPAAGLQDSVLEQARAASATDLGALRALHADNSPAPALLLDALKRARLNQEARRLPERIRAGEPADEDTHWSPAMAVELPGWPAHQGIDVYAGDSLTGPPIRYGSADATQVLVINEQALNLGKLPERLVDAADEAQLQALLGDVPVDRAARVQALRNKLAERLADHHGEVFEYLYTTHEDVSSQRALAVRRTLPDLPRHVVSALLDQARPDELNIINAERRLPLRLLNLGRGMALDARGSHAFEGLSSGGALSADSERLALNTLKLHSDAFGETRLEIRQHQPGGTLRCAAGPGDATQVRLLVRDEHGHYAVYDGAHRRLHAATDIYHALLLALPDAARTRLGYSVSEGPRLRAWLMQQLAPLETRRTLLASPGLPPPVEPERLAPLQMPRFRWASQLLPGSPPSVERRLKVLYPQLPPERISELAVAYNSPEGLPALDDLEVQKKQLVEDLENWVRAPAQSANHDQRHTERMVRSLLGKALRKSWERSSSGYIDALGERRPGSHLDLQGWPLGANLRVMPTLRAPFGHVTSLALADTALNDASADFLTFFPNLQCLDLTANQLTTLPPAVATMPRLTQLDLGANLLHWDEHSLGQLSQLRALKTLDLSHNRRLTVSPDISAMPDLRELYLGNTRLADWPTGLFDQPRPAHFVLDLQNTPINSVPQFLPWLPEAELVARTRLDRNRLGLDAEERMVSYRLAAGLDPHRTYLPRGLQDSEFWLQDLSPRQRMWREAQWNELEQEHGSQGFFEVIRSLKFPEFFETPEDRQLYAYNRQALTRNVWRMFDALQGDEALRKRFFMMAGTPGNCADASAQIFNNLGVHTLVHEIYRQRPLLSAPAFAGKLAQVAKQKARLDQVNRIAAADVAQRVAPPERGGLGLRFSTEVINGVPGTVDEVQVHGAYQTGLKQRLDLPWLADHMVYRTTGGVEPQALETAYHRVLDGEQGDGLVNRMLEVDFWDDYLEATHGEALQRHTEALQEKAALVDDLQQAQQAWAERLQTPESEKATLRQALEQVADSLGIAREQAFSGQPLPDADYIALLENLAQEHKALRRQLTRQALAQQP